jgi:hypothetical protein
MTPQDDPLYPKQYNSEGLATPPPLPTGSRRLTRATPPPPEIVLPERLKHLVEYCQKTCDPGCCGIDAYDFSPLHVASYLSAYTNRISPSDIAEWEQELTKANELVRDLTPNADGFVCSVAGMNQYFTRQTFADFMEELRHSIQVSPQVLDFSERLRHAPNVA